MKKPESVNRKKIPKTWSLKFDRLSWSQDYYGPIFGKSTHRVSSAHGSCMVVCNAWGGEPSFLAEEAASMNGAAAAAAAGRGCGGGFSKDAHKALLVTTSRESRVDQATVLLSFSVKWQHFADDSSYIRLRQPHLEVSKKKHRLLSATMTKKYIGPWQSVQKTCEKRKPRGKNQSTMW